MNTAEAKKIPITKFLGVDSSKNEFFIKSPFNPNERTPSFKINQSKNIWYDHARGEGGNIIDLVISLHNCSVSDALKILDDNSFSFSPARTDFKEDTPNIEVKKISSLGNEALVKYLRDRKIDLGIAQKYLKEIYYSKNEKNYFSLAFENDSGGFETRNPYFKGCIGKKDITTIKGTQSDKLSIFEGFMDFLSALTYYKVSSFKGDVIILNSIANKQKIEEKLYSNIYKKIYLFLDNDKGGEETKRYIFSKNDKCVDCSKIYNTAKDFNEFLLSI